MGVGACYSGTRGWGGFTSMIRLIRTSRQRSCTWERSAWNAREPGRRRSLCGRLRGFCRWSRAGSLPSGLGAGRAAAAELDRRLRADERFESMTGGRPELDIVVWKMRAATAALASELGQSIFSACARRNLHLALVQLPQFWFGPASDSSAPEGHVMCFAR